MIKNVLETLPPGDVKNFLYSIKKSFSGFKTIEKNMISLKFILDHEAMKIEDARTSEDISKPDDVMQMKPGAITEQIKPGPGGVDLTPAHMDLETKNAGGEIKFKVDAALLEQFQSAPGFSPVIINIQPMTDLRAFLGLKNPGTVPGAG